MVNRIRVMMSRADVTARIYKTKTGVKLKWNNFFLPPTP
jgi:hypothetical protein